MPLTNFLLTIILNDKFSSNNIIESPDIIDSSHKLWMIWRCRWFSTTISRVAISLSKKEWIVKMCRTRDQERVPMSTHYWIISGIASIKPALSWTLSVFRHIFAGRFNKAQFVGQASPNLSNTNGHYKLFSTEPMMLAKTFRINKTAFLETIYVFVKISIYMTILDGKTKEFYRSSYGFLMCKGNFNWETKEKSVFKHAWCFNFWCEDNFLIEWS